MISALCDCISVQDIARTTVSIRPEKINRLVLKGTNREAFEWIISILVLRLEDLPAMLTAYLLKSVRGCISRSREAYFFGEMDASDKTTLSQRNSRYSVSCR